MHDRIAELRGLRAELDNAQNGPRRETRKDAIADIKNEIERRRGELAEDADRLDAESRDLADQGQDGRAGDAAVSARVIRTALEADEAADQDPDDPGARVALAEARGRALAAANELRQRDEQKRLREHLSDAEDDKPARGRSTGKRNAAAPKPPAQT
ncbi:hypothetical protein V2S66_33010 [Streptomyces sp. V4-01]|uniref:Uncharacterized protein n=1 Tax=Actinacidiphila polyblastidii TaxID=3110430 RepID=A0ABU7PP39_9ACTN|nr:hypothetical protein [Streptomyces sp. V4-01]